MRSPPAQLTILASLQQPHSVAELATMNALSHATALTAVDVLDRAGLVRTQRVGRARLVSAASPTLASAARAVVHDVARPDWASVFHGDRPTWLWVLDRIGSIAMAAEVCGTPLRTFQHFVQDMLARGIVRAGGGRRVLAGSPHEAGPVLPEGGIGSTGTRYELNPRLRPLLEFLAQMDRLQAHHRLQDIDPDAGLVWHLGPELLFTSFKPSMTSNVFPGGPSALAQVGVDLMGTREYHHAALRTPTAADAILQMLVVDPTSLIHRSYAALALELARPRDLHEKARLYGLDREALSLEDYVRQRRDAPGFLPWKEHERYRKQYARAT